jgi:hypothetical protein
MDCDVAWMFCSLSAMEQVIMRVKDIFRGNVMTCKSLTRGICILRKKAFPFATRQSGTLG